MALKQLVVEKKRGIKEKGGGSSIINFGTDNFMTVYL